MIPEDVRFALAHMYYYCESNITNPGRLEMLEAVRTWLETQEVQPTGEWVPVEDGLLQLIGDDRIDVSDDGEYLGLEDDFDHVVVQLPDDIRLCRKVKPEGTT